MDASTLWWVAAAALLIAEMLTGTVYLLALALGGAAGALAAHAAAGFAVQVAAAATLGMAATLLWHRSKMRQRQAQVAPAQSNADVQQDIGAEIFVPEWQADGTAQVSYRGALWRVMAATEAGAGRAPQAGMHRVTQVVGNRLVLAPV